MYFAKVDFSLVMPSFFRKACLMRMTAVVTNLCLLWMCPSLFAGQYVVKSGDTMYAIAKSNGLTTKELQAANPKVAPGKLTIGTVLQLPDPVAKGTVAPAKKELTEGEYEVLPGDTLTKIAKSHGVSVKELMALNPSLKPERMRAGEHIRVGRASREPKASQVVKSPAKAVETKHDEVNSSEKTPSTKGTGATGAVSGGTEKPAQHDNSTAGASAAVSHVPEDVAQAAPAAADAAKTQHGQQSTADTTSNNVDFRLITLQKEMTLNQIAAEHRTTPEWLLRVNGWTGTVAPDATLSVDSEVRVPVQP